MDSEDNTLEINCENLMNVVVESRKRFGKMCVNYDHNTSLVENKMLNLQIETYSNFKFKSKYSLPDVIEDDSKEMDDFAEEVKEMTRRYEELRKKLKNTQELVNQLKSDDVGRRLGEPLTSDALLSKAKEKNI